MRDDDFEDDVVESEPLESDAITADKEDLVENDELEPWEEGFMEGAESSGPQAKCNKCGKLLDRDATIEKEIEGEIHRFCSDICADSFEPEE